MIYIYVDIHMYHTSVVNQNITNAQFKYPAFVLEGIQNGHSFKISNRSLIIFQDNWIVLLSLLYQATEMGIFNWLI